MEPELGQTLGVVWHKLWHREPKPKPPADETHKQKRVRQAAERQAARSKPFEEKESERWVEAFKAGKKQFQAVQKQLEETAGLIDQKARIIQSFDREGDIAEVFDCLRPMARTGVIVRAAHDRSLNSNTAHLWEHMRTQPIQFYQEVELSKTAKRSADVASLAVRFCPVQLRSPRRLKHQDAFEVYAVYAQEIEPEPGEEPVSWMLLTTEKVTTAAEATTILRWYTYRWHVEDYHQILKSGCQVESYRLAATSMEALLGFLTVIAAELLRVTYLHRTQPQAPAEMVLTTVQMDVLKARSSKLPKVLTVAWAVEAVARLGGYLEHRQQTPIGIQVLWRGWWQLETLCQGWQLALSD